MKFLYSIFCFVGLSLAFALSSCVKSNEMEFEEVNDVGADVKTIQGVLGQRDFKTTADRYVHSRNERKQEAALKVSNLLKTTD